MYVKLVEKFLGCYVYFIPVCLALVLSSVFLLNRTREAIKVSGIINMMAELRIMNVLEKKRLHCQRRDLLNTSYCVIKKYNEIPFLFEKKTC